jgi:hypothetical protein
MNEKKCEICNQISFIDRHHIQSLSKNGNNYDYNKCEICPNCHRKVHKGDIILEGRFLTTSCKSGNKTELIWRKKGEKSITGVKDPLVWIYNS